MSDNVIDHKPIVLEHRQVGEAVGDFPPDRRLQLPLTAEERTVLRGRRCSDCGRSLLLQLPREGPFSPVIACWIVPGAGRWW